MASIYEQMSNYLTGLIKENKLKPNDKLPSERLFVDQFQSTRITIREALFRLESDGLVYRLNRKGWFLAPERFVIDPTRKAGFMTMAERQNRLATTRLLSVTKIRSTAPIRRALMQPVGAAVLEIRRVRSLDGRALVIEYIYLDAERFQDIADYDLSGSITEIQKRHYNAESCGEDCSIRIEAFSDEQARILEVNPGSPCLKIARTRLESEAQALEYFVEHWLHSAVELTLSVR